jgi:hypothetical protein
MLSTCYVRNPDVVLREEDEDGGLLFNPDTGEVLLLNSTGLFLWQLCTGEHSVSDMLREITDSFDGVPQAEVEDDTLGLLVKLVKAGYLGFEQPLPGR